jgi:hypothetical protein
VLGAGWDLSDRTAAVKSLLVSFDSIVEYRTNDAENSEVDRPDNLHRRAVRDLSGLGLATVG